MVPIPSQKTTGFVGRVFIPFNLRTHQKRILRGFPYHFLALLRFNEKIDLSKMPAISRRPASIEAGACPGPVDCSPLTVVAKDYKGAVVVWENGRLSGYHPMVV